MTQIPGIKAVHAIITPTCRRNRGNQLALHEAFCRVEREYSAILSARKDEFVCHVVLIIEDAPSVVDGPKSADASGASSPNPSVPANAQVPMENKEREALQELYDCAMIQQSDEPLICYDRKSFIEKLREALAHSLIKEQPAETVTPKCDLCEAPATRRNDTFLYCDEHAPKGSETI